VTHDVWIPVADLSIRTERVVLLDVRYALGDPDGHAHYLEGHLPGAVYVDLDTELAAPPSPAAGRHPLPDPADLQRSARRWGIGADDLVVAYDDWNGMAAARAWWLLRWAGVADVRILDGGLAGWTGAGLPVESGEVIPAPGDVELTSGGMPVLDADAAAVLARDGILLDARAGERYRGETEPIDPRPGHIPGARSAPTAGNVDADGLLRPAAELTARFAEVGATGPQPVGVYCGSGVTAAHEVAVLAGCGIEAALYPGSWSQWSSDPGRPVVTGAEPG
jgi:thiosulfate/3-mercaptopyruvate sulfurtransferase